MKSKNITIGVPIHMIELSVDEIKEKLTENKRLEHYTGTKVNMTIRIAAETADLLREGAELNAMTIVDFTAALLNYEE